MKKKILLILGHPDTDSFCGTLASTYVDSATASGFEVRELRLGDMSFDPILWKGYHTIQALEPDLVRAQELIKWSDHMVWTVAGR